jgi:hypothetical protein
MSYQGHCQNKARVYWSTDPGPKRYTIRLVKVMAADADGPVKEAR